MKALCLYDVPNKFTGIVEWGDGDVSYLKNGNLHREDGPSLIKINGFKEWNLDGKCIWFSAKKLDLTNKIILSKTQHHDYPLVQVWKVLDKNEIYDQIIIPGMEEHIRE